MLPFEDHFLCLGSLLQCEEQKHLSRLEKIENCFRLSFLFWMDMDRKIRETRWNKEDRIFISKQVNPLYLSTLEYYQLLYHAALFLPTEKAALSDFWRRENNRKENF